MISKSQYLDNIKSKDFNNFNSALNKMQYNVMLSFIDLTVLYNLL